MNCETLLIMTADEAFVGLETTLGQGCLNPVQTRVFRGCWEGQTYLEIASSSSYDVSYIKDVGSKLWQLLSDALGEKVTKSNFRSVLSRQSRSLAAHRPPASLPDNVVILPAAAPVQADNWAVAGSVDFAPRTLGTRQDWGEAVDVSTFYGRTEELSKLRQWIVDQRCRLVAVLGMGGIGKTSLSIKLAEQAQGDFDCLIWRSLRNAPPVQEILASLIRFLSKEQEIDLPDDVDGRITRLLDYLRASRCLLVLDNVETILRSGDCSGHYRDGFEGYGELFRRLAEAFHRSVVVLTSREKPREIALLEGETLPVRSLQLDGLQPLEAQKIFAAKGTFSGSESEWCTLINHYAGNPLALKMVAPLIQDLLDGSIPECLDYLRRGTLVFEDIRDLLDRQFSRLSPPEKEVMYWLAINRELVSLPDLQDDVLSFASKRKLPEALKSLGRRSLVEKNSGLFTQQPAVMEYVTERLIEQICDEILSENISLLMSHALLKAQAKDYIREAQARLILGPLGEKLKTLLRDKPSTQQKLNQILLKLKQEFLASPGYGGGNLINLLRHLEIDLTGYDFSELSVWQAHLQGINLHRVNFAQANLAKSVFTETLSVTLCVAFSPNGQLLATGDADGEIRLWQVKDGRKLVTCKGHSGGVWSVAFSPDGQTLVSGSEDQTLCLWEVSTGRCCQTLQHGSRIWSVAFSPQGQTVASGCEDQTIRLWNAETGECEGLWRGHTDWVRSVAFSPNGQTLASSSNDQTVKLWDVPSGHCRNTLQGHTSRVWTVAWSPDGQTLASGCDRTVKLWEVQTGECRQTWGGHLHWVRSVAFSPDGQTLVSGSEDQTLRLWEVRSGQCRRILQGHTGWVRSVAFSPDGQTLASGSGDHTVKLWEMHTGRCCKTWQGHSARIWSVVFSPDGQTLASGSDDHTVRLWDVPTGQCRARLQGHAARVRSVAFSPDGQTLASSSDDQTIKLWDVHGRECRKTLHGQTNWVWSLRWSPDGHYLASGSDHTVKLMDVRTGECCQTLRGHSARVWSVNWSPDGQLLASGSDEHTIKLWQMHTGVCLKTLRGHTNWVWSVAFSPDGQRLASGSGDHTVKLWQVDTGECSQTLQGHSSRVWSVRWSPDGQLLASGSADHTVKLWQASTGACLRTLHGHTSLVWSVAFSPDGQTLASSSQDETIRLWDVQTGECLKILGAAPPYQDLNIAGVTGISDETLATLKALGAAERA